MSASGADDRTKRSWGSGTHHFSPGGRYFTTSSSVSARLREEEERRTGGAEQGDQEPDAVFVVKRDSTVIHVSHPGYGATKGGGIGRSILGFFAQEFSADIISTFERVFALGEPQSFVCCGNPPLAVGSWYRCLVYPNLGDSGVESATVFVRDITEWKHNEDEFRAEIDALRSQIKQLSCEKDELTDALATHEQREEELSRFREIMNHAGEAIFITDPHTGRFVDVNETACRWLGCSRERLLRMGVGDLDLEFPLENRDGVIEHVTDTRDANRPKELVLGAHRRRNGTSFPVEVTISPRRFGDHDFLLVVARDVKQRNRTQRAYLDAEYERRGLSEISRDAVYCTARDGTICEVNDSALALFGYTRDEFTGLEAERLFGDAEHLSVFKRAVDENGFVKNLRAEFQTKSGRLFHGFLGATLRHGADGIVQGYQCIIAPVPAPEPEPASPDIPDRRALEEEAEQARRELEEARSAARGARADAEQALLQVAQAKLESKEALQRSEALLRRAQQAKRELEGAKSEAAKAQVEADQARRELENAKSETAQAKLETEAVKERIQQLEREVESKAKETNAAVLDAARAWAEIEEAERQARAQIAAASIPAPESETAHSEGATAVHVGRLPGAEASSTRRSGSHLLVAPQRLNRGGREPELWPKRRTSPLVWLVVAVMVVAATAVGSLTLSSADNRVGEWVGTAGDSLVSGRRDVSLPEDSVTSAASGSDVVNDSPAESMTDSLAGR